MPSLVRSFSCTEIFQLGKRAAGLTGHRYFSYQSYKMLTTTATRSLSRASLRAAAARRTYAVVPPTVSEKSFTRGSAR